MTNHGSQERRYHVRHSRHHHFHYGQRSSRSRSQDAERRMEQSSKPKEYESAIITSSKHSNVECNKSDNIKLVEDQIVVSSQIETVTESKPREPPAVLASVAAVVATMKAQQSSESVFNRISPHQTIPSQLTDIPKYYNAKMVNAAKLAQQAEKRKLLWGDNKGSASDKVNDDEHSTNIYISDTVHFISGENVRDDISQRMDEPQISRRTWSGNDGKIS